MIRLLPAIAILTITACSYVDVEREIGYKGPARINPWLAAERFAGSFGFEVVSTPSWMEPGPAESIWFIPGMLIDTQLFARQLTDWLDRGGHLVVLLENTESGTSDWQLARSTPPVIEPPLRNLIEHGGITIVESETQAARPSVIAHYRNRAFRIESTPHTRVHVRHSSVPPERSTDFDRAPNSADSPGNVATVHHGLGRLTVVADARIFRNRWIGESDHADLLAAILQDADASRTAGFMRGSGLSFWRLLRNHLWPILLAFCVWLVFWLWRCFGRFGPLKAADEPTPIRGYDYHLEALGGFQWDIDHAAGLLAPLRTRITENGHHLAARAGKREQDFPDILAARSGLPRETIVRALDPATTPRDPATLTQLTSDLQKILHHIP